MHSDASCGKAKTSSPLFLLHGEYSPTQLLVQQVFSLRKFRMSGIWRNTNLEKSPRKSLGQHLRFRWNKYAQKTMRLYTVQLGAFVDQFPMDSAPHGTSQILTRTRLFVYKPLASWRGGEGKFVCLTTIQYPEPLPTKLARRCPHTPLLPPLPEDMACNQA